MPKILIADDSRLHLTLLHRELKAKDFEVIAAEDGLQASMLAMRAQPDAIVLDLGMPGGSGLEVLRRLKRSTRTKFIPVIILTANSDPAVREMTISLGASEFLQKPVDFDQLTQKISDLVKSANSANRTPESAAAAALPVPAVKEVLPESGPKPSRSWREIFDKLEERDPKQF